MQSLRETIQYNIGKIATLIPNLSFFANITLTFTLCYSQFQTFKKYASKVQRMDGCDQF